MVIAGGGFQHLEQVMEEFIASFVVLLMGIYDLGFLNILPVQSYA